MAFMNLPKSSFVKRGMAEGALVGEYNPLEGMAGLVATLKELGAMEDGKAIRKAIRKGIAPAYERAVATAPESEKMHRTYMGRLVAPGFTKRSIRFITKLSPDKQMGQAIMGVRKEAFYSLTFVERGTKKIVPARPWLEPAFRGTQGAQEGEMAESLRDTIEKICAKGRGRRGGA